MANESTLNERVVLFCPPGDTAKVTLGEFEYAPSTEFTLKAPSTP